MHAIEGLMGVTMEKLREMVDVNTIIGDPITSPDGTVIIPVSKVSFGFASGGSDIPAKVQKDVFGGGTGAGISIQPIAFIVIREDGVKLMQMTVNASAANNVVNLVPEVIDKLSEVFGKNKKQK